jgi:hypothetical protein
VTISWEEQSFEWFSHCKYGEIWTEDYEHSGCTDKTVENFTESSMKIDGVVF